MGIDSLKWEFGQIQKSLDEARLRMADLESLYEKLSKLNEKAVG